MTGVRRIVLWLMSTLTVLVLLLGYHTSTSSRITAAGETSAISPITGGAGSTSGTATTSPSAAAGSASGAGSASTGASTAAPASPSAGSTSVTGDVAQTRWGPVQVQITVAGGQITDVAVVQYPTENGKDRQINARALPELIDETMSAQSADIDMVSGATVTSEGYVESLQSALDQAGL